MTFREEILAHFVDPDGLVTIDPNPGKWTTGNGLMHLGFFICLLYGSGQLQDSDVELFNRAVSGCQEGNDPGVYDRNPGRQDANAHDDSNGVVSGSVVSGFKFQADVLSHGLKHFFVYENVDGQFNGFKDLWAFRLRFPFIVLWYFLVNRKIKFLIPLMKWFLDRTKSSSDADNVIMDYCKVESLACVFPELNSWRNEWIRGVDLKAASRDYFNKPSNSEQDSDGDWIMEHPIVHLATELKEKI